jgi:hypothetical protein
MWREPRLQEPRVRRLFSLPVAVDAVLGVVAIAWFALVVYAGFAGSDVASASVTYTAILILLWVGVPVASVLFGDVFRLLNPWLAVARFARWASRGRGWRTRPYPERLGRWPAAVGIALFGWLELVYHDVENPTTLAVLALIYAAVQLVGMAVFGIEAWTDRADPFSVYFSMFARLSVFERRDGVLYARRPLSGPPSWPVVPGTIALLAVAIGVTTFDGFSNSTVWTELRPDLADLFGGGIGGNEVAATIGLVACILLVAGIYRLGVAGMRTVDRSRSEGELARAFVHSLIPIAFAYLFAHYFSLLVFQGQAMGYLISDPLGDGSDIFGTADKGIDYKVIGSEAIWYVQVAALIVGHVSALVLAHDRAIALYKRARDATRSQYWMLVVMVGFTSLGLWLLSAIEG